MNTIAAMAGIAIFAFALLWAAVCDARTMNVPNRIVILLVVSYFPLALLAGFSLREIGLSVAVTALIYAMFFVAFSRGWIGGGDAKLMAGTALWLGAGQVFSFLLWTALFGGLLAVAALVFRAIPLKTVSTGPAWALHLHGLAAGLPLAVAIAAAGLMRLFSSSWMLAAY